MTPAVSARQIGRLRVLVVIASRQVWGLERSVLELAPELQKMGIDLVLGSPPGGDLEAAWRALGLERIPLALPQRAGIRPGGEGSGGPSAGILLKESVASLRTTMAVARAARSVDLVHSHSLWSHLDCVLAGRLVRRPVVVEVHDLVAEGLGRRLLGLSARGASATIAISGAVAGVVGDGSRTDVRVVPQAVDLEYFSPHPPDRGIRQKLTDDPDGLLVGIVGRIDPMKGIDVLVRAMAQVTGPAANARLVVVGAPGLDRGDYERQVKEEAERQLGSRARFVGQLGDIPGVISALDVLVNASAAEPFGLTVLEAQASGIPVIAAAAGGIPDFVTDDDNGILVPPGEPVALARALERLLGDPALRARLGRRGRETAVAAHGLEGRVETMSEIYRSVARGKRP
jgi:glycosyltransferase involved in cell wall biosynthesis